MPETSEIPQINEIRERNAEVLKHAIERLGESLLAEIDFLKEKVEYSEKKEIKLFLKGGLSIQCEIVVVFEREISSGSKMSRDLRILLLPAGEFGLDKYERDPFKFGVKGEISTRIWHFALAKSNSVLSINGSVETTSRFKGIGIGTVLFVTGEILKTRVATAFAQAHHKKVIESVITDENNEGWTKKKMSSLEGYFLDTSSLRPRYIKIEQVAS